MFALIMKMLAAPAARPLFVIPCGSWHASQLYANPSAAASWLFPENPVFPCVFTRLFCAVVLPVFVWQAPHSAGVAARPVTAFTLSDSRFPAYVLSATPLMWSEDALWHSPHDRFAAMLFEPGNGPIADGRSWPRTSAP